MDNLLQPLLIGACVGAASGAVGAFILLRRMALVGDALSHVALPGIALALAFKADPFWGVLAPLVLAAVLIWWLEGRTSVPADALVGVLFTSCLAIGVLTIPNTEIIESLFGAFPRLPAGFLAGILLAAAGLMAVSFRFAGKFLLVIVDPDLARTEGIGRGYDLALLLIFSLVVALGVKLVGTLLMGALTIIPAAIGRNLCRSMHVYMLVSALAGGATAVAGVLIADAFSVPPGPSIILLGTAVFLATLVFARRRHHVSRTAGS
ncbi:MAG: metal ABC transporter permease [Bryobacteraceae bacterium]|jgi:zinc transport system permease protein